jgi:hypothetical protein
MFESNYPFNYRFNQKNRDDETIISHDLHFFCKNNQKYVVVVDQYPEGFFVIQFYLWKYRKYKDKYYRTANSCGSNVKVISTCFHIMLYFMSRYPFASFVFQGILDPKEHLKNTCRGQTNSQRYRIYEYIVEAYIDNETFSHLFDHEKNVYLLLNGNDPRPDIVEIIEKRYLSFLS